MATVDVDIKQLLEAGAHFGHQTSRWQPKMAPYLHSKRGGSHIIDLTKTVECLQPALNFLEETAASGKQILFVGTKKQAKAIVKPIAEELGMPFVVERWLGGMLTNKATIGGRIKHLKDLEEKMANGTLAAKYSKLEVQRYQEEIDAMNHIYGGIKNMAVSPGAVVVFDVITDVNAVREANKLNVPIVALVDSNADPTQVKYPIPSNDDAIKTLQLMAGYFKQAVAAGQAKYQKKAEKAAPAADKDDKKSE